MNINEIDEIDEKIKQKISYEMFGTTDYRGALKVIARSSVMFRMFHTRVLEEYKKGEQ